MSQTLRLARFTVFIIFAFILPARPTDAAGSASPDDTARFLAGMQPSADSPLAELARDESWQRHAKFFDSAWSGLDKRQLSKIRAWAGENLTAPRPVMFYMFSGPDFLYADAFFPKASTYVLSGLEPVGQIPDILALPRRSIPSELRELEASLNNVLNLSFFITKNMQRQLNSSKLRGTLPILYVFLARSGKAIRDVSLIGLEPDGTVHAAAEAGPKAAKGVKIEFSSSDGRTQTLYYFSTDLSNGGVKNSGFLKFCEQLGTGDSLVKSASYLLHSDSFSTVRDFLLQHSDAIVQDDSGIPVRSFKSEDWQLRPFGRYLGPISIFKGSYQTKLSELFRKGRPAPLDFGIGYRWRARESNLLLATKSPVKAQQNQ